MKIKRYKKVYKDLSFYINYFQFRPPYQVIIDGTFCLAALNNKINIKDNIPKYLQDECKFLTTQCVIIEMETLGKKVFGALIVLKQFGLHKCGHEGKPLPAAECLQSMAGTNNANHYIIATQDRELQKRLRQVAGVPLLYLHQKTPVLDHPSEVSVQKAKGMKQERFGVPQEERNKLNDFKEKQGIMEEKEIYRKRKRKGGPNPLSCKKKKKTSGNGTKVLEVKDKGEIIKRKKVRIPSHVKELVKEQE